MSNTCGEEKGLQRRQAKMLHLLSDNYLIPTLLLSVLAFDLLRVSLQDKHKITGESNEFKSPILYCYMCNQGISLPHLFPALFLLLSSYYLSFHTCCFSPVFAVCVCAAYMPLDTFATDYGMTQMPVEKGASPIANCTYFRSQDLQVSFQRAPSLVNRTRVCGKETELHL